MRIDGPSPPALPGIWLPRRSASRSWFSLALILGMAGPLAGAQDRPLPEIDELSSGWNTISPGGATGCANGGPYEFYVHPGDRDRVLVFLEGGGACWDADTCDPDRADPVYSASLEDIIHPRYLSGVFDLDHPDNPVAGFTMVFGPYCTGDVHLGNRLATYTADGGEMTIRHLGYTNATALLDWVTSNLPDLETVVVSGSSAGAVGTPVHASRLAQALPDARVVALSDGAGSYRGGALPELDPSVWGTPGVLAGTPGWEAYPFERFGTETLTRHAATTAPNLSLAQVDQALDAVQRFYLDLAGNPDPDVGGLLARNRTELARDVPGFAGFTIGGVEHTVLGLPQLYFYAEDGERLSSWMAAVVRGEAPGSPSCGDCGRPTLVFFDRDAALLDAALEVLADEDGWDPAQPESAACPVSATRRSLWCALVAAAGSLNGPGPLEYAATWEVAYEAMDRRGDDSFDQPLTRYNNDPGTGYADVIDVLRTVRAKVRTRAGS